MTTDRIHELFAIIGKMLYIDALGDAWESTVRATVVGLFRQDAAAVHSADHYSEFQNCVSPTVVSLRGVLQSINRLPQVAKTGVDLYLRTVAPELGQSVNTAPATILNALKTAMETDGQTVATGGVIWSWIRDTYGVQFPQDDSPTIADDVITVEIV